MFSVQYEYYASQSNLTPKYRYTLRQHMLAYFAPRSELAGPTYSHTLEEHAESFYENNSGLSPSATLSQHITAYFASLSGLTPAAKYTVRQHAEAVFSGVTPSNNTFTSTFGSNF